MSERLPLLHQSGHIAAIGMIVFDEDMGQVNGTMPGWLDARPGGAADLVGLAGVSMAELDAGA